MFITGSRIIHRDTETSCAIGYTCTHNNVSHICVDSYGSLFTDAQDAAMAHFAYICLKRS